MARFPKILDGICYGFIVAVTCIIAWLSWAILIYRWDLGRLGGLIIKKYTLHNAAKLVSDSQNPKQLVVTDVRLSPDKSIVIAEIHIIDAINRNIFEVIPVTYNISAKCSLLDAKCILG